MTTPFAIARDVPLAGEIVCWDSKGSNIGFSAVVRALNAVGLDDTVVRARLPRNAFSRACRKLDEARVIRMLDDEGGTLRFQFTAEHRSGETFDYSLEAIVELNKTTGEVFCESQELATEAQKAVDEAMEMWTANDITQVVQRLYDRHADMFAIRRQGGAYFVPQQHVEFSDKVEKFMQAMGGNLNRFAIAKADPKTEASIQESVARGLDALISEHRDAVEKFDLGTKRRDSTIAKAAERIKIIRFKVEAYSEYLGAEKARLEANLVAECEALKRKVKELADREDAEARTAAEKADSEEGWDEVPVEEVEQMA